MPKKLVILASILFVLIIGSFLAVRLGKPTVGNENPLMRVQIEKINKIIVKGPVIDVNLERENDIWNVKGAINDMANQTTVKTFIEQIAGFTVGSVISENEEKFGQFEISEDKAIRLQAFMEGEDEPRLDGWVGKQGRNFSNSYFRFANGGPVYIANDLSKFFVQRNADAYIEKNLFPIDMALVNEIIVTHDEKTVSITRSSDSWKTSPEKDGATPSLLKIFPERLKSKLVANRTATPDEIGVLGDSPDPLFQITLNAPDKTLKGKIFKNLISKDGSNEFYLAQLEGRSGHLAIPASTANVILDTVREIVR